MKKWLAALLLLFASPAFSSTASECEAEIPTGTPSKKLLAPQDTVFRIREIDDEIFSRIKGKSYKDSCPVPLSALRFLEVSHYDLDGNVRQGELICGAEIAADLLDIFRNLFNARYPIESIRLIDEFDADDVKSMQANNTSCFNFRPIAGSTKLSKHARGLAIDINPLYNPYVKRTGDTLTVSPPEGLPYTDRSEDFPCKIDENDYCYRQFVAHGFKWGGAWQSLKDYQHFEK